MLQQYVQHQQQNYYFEFKKREIYNCIKDKRKRRKKEKKRKQKIENEQSKRENEEIRDIRDAPSKMSQILAKISEEN